MSKTSKKVTGKKESKKAYKTRPMLIAEAKEDKKLINLLETKLKQANLKREQFYAANEQNKVKVLALEEVISETKSKTSSLENTLDEAIQKSHNFQNESFWTKVKVLFKDGGLYNYLYK